MRTWEAVARTRHMLGLLRHLKLEILVAPAVLANGMVHRRGRLVALDRGNLVVGNYRADTPQMIQAVKLTQKVAMI